MGQGITVLSLFDGMSCGQMALERAGIKVGEYYASEIKPTGIQITKENYPSTIQVGDVTKLNASDLPKIDLLLGGSPCQNLSQAMKANLRNGLKGDKSKLFFEYYRIFKEANPTWFLLENVGSMSQKDRDAISTLMGVDPINIKSDLVAPALRNRLYWTNITVPPLLDRQVYLNDVLTDGWSDRDKARCLLESDSRPNTTPVKMIHRYFNTGFTTLIFKSEAHYNMCKMHYVSNFKGLSGKEIDTKIIKEDMDLTVYNGVRYMNQRELELCQTVPVGYTKSLTRNDAAGLLGDGWTVDVIAWILKHM